MPSFLAAAMRAFEGKVALVVGATSGIGRVTAVAFAREGAKVVVAGRREAEGENTVRLIRETGSEGLFVQTDITMESEVEDLIHKTVVTYGRLDCAFNNAGTIGLSPLAEATAEHVRAIIDTNVKGIVFCLKHEIAQMLRTGDGAIVNMSSAAGLVGSRDRAAYSASKHAVIGLTKSAALETARRGIRVNAVCPAAIDGSMNDLFMTYFGLTKEQMADAVPLGRTGKPEEVAGAVLFLCSSQATFITGAVLPVDGGYSAQ